MKNNTDKQYLDLLKYILKKGELKGDRTGTGTISLFDYSMTFDMSEGFPLLTSKKIFTKAIIHELIWFLKGDTNIKYLVDNGVNIWNGDAYKNYKNKIFNGRIYPDDWCLKMGLSKEEFIKRVKTDDEFAKEWGELGPVYGKQWRDWGGFLDIKSTTITKDSDPKNGKYPYQQYLYVKGVDQIQNLIDDLKNNPDSRRLIVSAWNVGEMDRMVLPPCHNFFQCYTSNMNFNDRIEWWCKSIDKDISYADDVTEEFLNEKRVPKRKLSLKWNQRSVDSFLGLPFNIASYAILLHLLSRESNMVPDKLIFSGGDCHIYNNHIDQVKEQLNRVTFKLPELILSNKSINDIKFDDIKIIDYESCAVIKGDLSN